MVEKDQDDGAANLELPSLFGRRKKRSKAPAQTPVTIPPTPMSDEPAAEDTQVIGEVADAPSHQDPADHTEVIPRVTAPVATPVEPPAPVPDPEPEPEPVALSPEPAAQPEPVPVPVDRPTDDTEVAQAPVDDPPAERRAPKAPLGERVRDSLPSMAASTAAVVVGAVVGLVGCVLTYLSLQGCAVITGATTCGGPGLLVLILIVVAMVVLGAMLLRIFRVPEAGNLSFLGVGMMATLTLVFLIDYLFDAWMFAAIPVLTALCFGVSRWVTTRWTDDGEDERTAPFDIR